LTEIFRLYNPPRKTSELEIFLMWRRYPKERKGKYCNVIKQQGTAVNEHEMGLLYVLYISSIARERFTEEMLLINTENRFLCSGDMRFCNFVNDIQVSTYFGR
jgi:hypothetical protein